MGYEVTVFCDGPNCSKYLVSQAYELMLVHGPGSLAAPLPPGDWYRLVRAPGTRVDDVVFFCSDGCMMEYASAHNPLPVIDAWAGSQKGE